VTRPGLTALLAGLLALCCIYAYRLEQTEFRSHDAAGISRMSASTGNGSIAVSAGPDSVITAAITKRAFGRDSADAAQAIANVTVTDEAQAGQYSLRARMPGGNRNYGASFQVAAPESVALTLTTTNGNVTVSAMLAGITVSTTNGNLSLTGTAGTAGLSTTNGNVTVAVHQGGVNVQTTNGNVECDVAGLGATETVTIATTNGNVVLLLPADVSATVDLKTTDGTITIHGYDPVFEKQTKDHIRAKLGSGASAVTVSTSNGDIRVASRS